ncbi:lectin-like protein [Sandaracinus amylolyticus]|uniref:lectin-like protein n=1 Tax=Sandaracinus amylolyticus TaxID=927083 RepID=UPI001F315BBA|nr:lectin-like protein [Sandaracinus amylolyticus]
MLAHAAALVLGCGRVGFVADAEPREQEDASVDGPTSCVACAEWCNDRDDDCDGAIDEGAVCDGICARTRRSGLDLALLCDASTRDAAEIACAERGGALIAIADYAAHQAGLELLTEATQSCAWLDGSDATEEGAWQHADGRRFWTGAADGAAPVGAFASWRAGEPDDAGGAEDWLVLVADEGWADFPSDATCAALCARPVCAP